MNFKMSQLILTTLMLHDIPCELVYQGQDQMTGTALLKITVPRQGAVQGRYDPYRRLPGRGELTEDDLEIIQHHVKTQNLTCEVFDINLLIY